MERIENYDISTREENGCGYFINRDPDIDFEPGEIRAIIDTFSYANYIVPVIADNIINKCRNMQNIYELVRKYSAINSLHRQKSKKGNTEQKPHVPLICITSTA